MKNLHKYKYDIHSQQGEDGIINEILKRSFKKGKINTVEFGAGDIEQNSNTLNLIKNNQVNNAIFVEVDESLFKKLQNLKHKYKEITPIHKLVEYKEGDSNTLDNLLKKNDIKNDIDIMSIDIDSYDLDVFKSIKVYHPKLLIIEGGRQKYGVLSEHAIDKKLNSFSSIFNTVSKKYYLISYNGNLFFLNKDFFSKEHVVKNYYLDDEYHYLLHCIYYNQSKRNFFSNLFINILVKNKFILKLLINYKQ